LFSLYGRQNLIRREHNDELQKYITGIISGQGQKVIAGNSMADHFHILIGQTKRRAFRFGSSHQSRIVRLHQRPPVCRRQVLLAGRIWNVFPAMVQTAAD
jgi:REP element-mobilizing transposase RayT